MHTHSYREPEAFAGQRVVVVGASASGEDISREIARVARKVPGLLQHPPLLPVILYPIPYTLYPIPYPTPGRRQGQAAHPG